MDNVLDEYGGGAGCQTHLAGEVVFYGSDAWRHEQVARLSTP